MDKNIEARPRRTRRRFFTIMTITAAGVFGFLGLICCFGMEKDKFSRPSDSSRSAKRRGILLHELALTTVEAAKDERITTPKEAWIEVIYENYESFSLVRKGIVGSRLCMRLEYPEGKNVDNDPLWDDLYIMLNGKTPEAKGGIWNAKGVTLDFASQANDDIPKEGAVAICGKSGAVISRFRYSKK